MRENVIVALYEEATNMTSDNGYNYNWGIIKSDGNGSLFTPSPVVHFKFRPETNNDDVGGGGTGQYIDMLPVDAVCIMTINEEPTLDSIQYEIEIAKSKMIDDVKRLLGYVSELECSYGIRQIRYRGEGDTPETGSDCYKVECILMFEIIYTTKRSV